MKNWVLIISLTLFLPLVLAESAGILLAEEIAANAPAEEPEEQINCQMIVKKLKALEKDIKKNNAQNRSILNILKQIETKMKKIDRLNQIENKIKIIDNKVSR